MDFIDYYKLLELPRTASSEEIKKAFRKMARKYHPDLHPDDKDAKKRFQEINEAYEVLSDPEKRAKYDQYGANWKQGEAFEKAQAQSQYANENTHAGFSGYSRREGFQSDRDFSDFFESLFGQAASGGHYTTRNTPYKGADFQAELVLSLKAAANTHQQIIDVNGKKVRITIPAGISNSQKIKLKGYGAAGQTGGTSGDLYITFKIEPDSRYLRKGDDLYVSEYLPLYTAILGGEKEVETLQGKVKIKVNPLTQNETRIRLKGKGFPVYKEEGQFGDLFIKWVIDLPASLSDKEKELFQQLANQ